MAKAKQAKKAPKKSSSGATKKAPAKATLKASAKGSAAKAAKAKAPAKATTKIAAKAKSIVAAVAKAVKAPTKVAGKPTSKAGRKGKKKEELELDDDLLAGDEDLGSEEIPDLADFDEEEEEEIVEEVEASDDDDSAVVAEVKPPADEEIYLTDAEGRRYCRVRDCDQAATVEAYCRYHYLLLWKRIQVRRKILVDGKLERYVEELTSRYPDKFLEMIRKDLRNEKDFLSAIAELEIDDSGAENELEDEAQSYIDEVRGMTTESGIQDEEDF